MGKPELFISYSRRNKTFVEKLYQALNNQSYKIWVDWEDIPFSQDWWEEIKKGINAADIFIFIISSASLTSEVCGWELRHARETNKRIIPIIYESAYGEKGQLLPEVQAHIFGKDATAYKNWQALQKLNWLFFQDEAAFESNFENLKNTLGEDSVYVSQHTHLLQRALEWEESRQNSSYLLRGIDLDNAETWLNSSGEQIPAPSPLHISYIQISRQAQTRSQRTLFGASIIALAVTSILAVLSFILFQDSSRNATMLATQIDIAQTSQSDAEIQAETAVAAVATTGRNLELAQSISLAANAQETFGRFDVRNALALAYSAVNVDNPPPLSEQTLAEVAYAPGVRQIWQTPDENTVFTMAIHPNGDWIATGDKAGKLILWEIETEHILWQSNVHTGGITNLSFSIDGKRLVSTSEDETIIIWTTSTGKIERRLLGHFARVNAAVLNPSQTILASADIEGNLFLWDLSTGNQTGEVIAHNGSISSLDFSSDGTLLLASSVDLDLSLWDMETQTLIRYFSGHTEPVENAIFSPDDSQIISGGRDDTLILWDTNTGELLKRFVGHQSDIWDIDFSQDGRLLVSGGFDGRIIVWNLETGTIFHEFFNASNLVSGVQFTANDKRLISTFAEGDIVLWDLYDGQIVDIRRLHNDWVNDVVYSPDGEFLLTGSRDFTLRLWQDGINTKTHDFEHISVQSLAYHPNRAIAAVGLADARILLWNIENWEVINEFAGHEDFIHGLDFNHDGTLLASSSADNTVIIWDVSTGEILHRLEGHSDAIYDVAFTPDGQKLISASDDTSIIIWNVATGEQIRNLLGHDEPVRAITISSSGQWLLSGSWDKTLILWNIATGEALQRLEGANNLIYDVVLSPDGTYALASAGTTSYFTYDSEVILWSIPDGNLLRRTNIPAAVAFSLDIRPDGLEFVSGSEDGQLIRWRMDDFAGLLSWVQENREIEPLSCNALRLYQIQADCE